MKHFTLKEIQLIKTLAIQSKDWSLATTAREIEVIMTTAFAERVISIVKRRYRMLICVYKINRLNRKKNKSPIDIATIKWLHSAELLSPPSGRAININGMRNIIKND